MRCRTFCNNFINCQPILTFFHCRKQYRGTGRVGYTRGMGWPAHLYLGLKVKNYCYKAKAKDSGYQGQGKAFDFGLKDQGHGQGLATLMLVSDVTSCFALLCVLRERLHINNCYKITKTLTENIWTTGLVRVDKTDIRVLLVWGRCEGHRRSCHRDLEKYCDLHQARR